MLCSKCNEPIDKKPNKYYCDTCASNANRKSRKKLKMNVLEKVGMSCVCCGVDEWWNLEIDHITPTLDSSNVSKRNYIMYNGIITGVLSPHDYQTLCSGCNKSKNQYDRCRIEH